MAAELDDNYGDGPIDIDVTVKTMSNGIPFLSVILTKVRTADDFVDGWSAEPPEIEAFFAAVRAAEAEYRRLTT
jgi:hypothetical protein